MKGEMFLRDRITSGIFLLKLDNACSSSSSSSDCCAGQRSTPHSKHCVVFVMVRHVFPSVLI